MLFADTQLTGSLADRLALGDQNLRLAQVADNLPRGITLIMTVYLNSEMNPCPARSENC